MIPKKDAKGVVSIELTTSEEKKLLAAYSVLDQLAYHTRGTKFRGVANNQICDAANTVADLTAAKVE